MPTEFKIPQKDNAHFDYFTVFKRIIEERIDRKEVDSFVFGDLIRRRQIPDKVLLNRMRNHEVMDESKERQLLQKL